MLYFEHTNTKYRWFTRWFLYERNRTTLSVSRDQHKSDCLSISELDILVMVNIQIKLGLFVVRELI